MPMSILYIHTFIITQQLHFCAVSSALHSPVVPQNSVFKQTNKFFTNGVRFPAYCTLALIIKYSYLFLFSKTFVSTIISSLNLSFNSWKSSILINELHLFISISASVDFSMKFFTLVLWNVNILLLLILYSSFIKDIVIQLIYLFIFIKERSRASETMQFQYFQYLVLLLDTSVQFHSLCSTPSSCSVFDNNL